MKTLSLLQAAIIRTITDHGFVLNNVVDVRNAVRHCSEFFSIPESAAVEVHLAFDDKAEDGPDMSPGEFSFDLIFAWRDNGVG